MSSNRERGNRAALNAQDGIGTEESTIDHPPYESESSAKADAWMACFHMGNKWRVKNRLDEAISCYKKAISLRSDYAEAYNNMGLAFQAKGEIEEAIACFERAIGIDPKLFQACFNMGVSLKAKANVDDAILYFQRALLLKPDLSEAYNRLGAIFRKQGQLDKAIYCFRKELEINPKDVRAYNNLGSTFHDKGEVDKAIHCFETSLRLRPDHVETEWNLALAHLLCGNYAEGWCGYECRFRRRAHKPTLAEIRGIPRWDGSSFVGKRLLVEGEQGFGDNLQFVRYMPMVKERGGKVILKIGEPLLTLFRGINGIDEVVTTSTDAVSIDDMDLYIPMMSLPCVFKTTFKIIPCHVPYIHADPKEVTSWRDQIKEGKLKVGVVWAGNPGHKDDRNRSCPLERFEPLTRIPGVALYSLQKDVGEDSKRLHEMNIINLGPVLKDFSITAGVIANLDLVVSVDTAVAHLAGTMGKSIWLLLPFAPDWRWLLDRDDSPWYPTMRLFRQRRPGDWDGVLARVCKKLKFILNP